jgi:hypothetical protein
MAEPKQKKRKADTPEVPHNKSEEKQMPPLRGLAAKWLKAASDATISAVTALITEIEQDIEGNVDCALSTEVAFDVKEGTYDNEDFRRCISMWLKHNGVYSCFSTSGHDWQLNIYRDKSDEQLDDKSDQHMPENPLTRAWLVKTLDAIK